MKVLMMILVGLLCLGGGISMAEESRLPVTLARESVNELLGTLQRVLKKELREKGPAGAIKVCAEEAPRILQKIRSRYPGLYLRRTTLRPRNPANAPTKDEKELLLKLETLAKEGRLPKEVVDVVKINGRWTLRYARVLRIKPVCMLCHGTSQTIPPGVRAILARRYPQDRATGYHPGDFRGIVIAKIPLE